MSGISVVVPSWNDYERLKECLEALASQTIRDRLEIVVSLDGGGPLPDDVAGLADLVVTGSHAGPATARNRGWIASKGEYILFTDSDCIPGVRWAERMTGALESGADAVKGAYSHGGDRIVQRLAQVEFQERYRMLQRSDHVDMIDTYSAGFRRNVLEEACGFDQSFPVADHEDVDLSYRLASAGMKLAFVPEALVAHHHSDSWAGYFRLKFSRGKWRLRVVKRFPEKALTDSYTPVCLKLQIIMAFLLVPVLAVMPFSALPAAAWAVLFLVVCLPLLRVALREDAALAPVIPVFALWRGLALGSGSLRGLLPYRK